jgi:hypothetical protein
MDRQAILLKAFSSEVDTGSRKKNASNKRLVVPFGRDSRASDGV